MYLSVLMTNPQVSHKVPIIALKKPIKNILDIFRNCIITPKQSK